jgi:hypothetical protein
MAEGDRDLEELASLVLSARAAAIGILLGIVFGAAAGAIGIAVGGSPKWIAGLVIAGVGGAFVVAMRMRTPPTAFPSIRVLRDRPGDVAHIVSIHKGNQYLALVGRDGRLLAKPLTIKGAADTVRSRVNAAAAEESARDSRAVAIASKRSPQARHAAIVDLVGLTSLAKLATKAIAKLPS